MTDTEIVSTEPKVIHQGIYRLYERSDGGMHLVYLRDGAEKEDHMDLPAGMIRLSKAMSEGTMSFPQFMREAMSVMAELKR